MTEETSKPQARKNLTKKNFILIYEVLKEYVTAGHLTLDRENDRAAYVAGYSDTTVHAELRAYPLIRYRDVQNTRRDMFGKTISRAHRGGGLKARVTQLELETEELARVVFGLSEKVATLLPPE